MKWCSRCESEKRSDEFGSNRQRKDGLDLYCRECRNRAARERYRSDPEGFRQQTKWRQIKSLYGLTKADWMTLFDAQQGRCAICGTALAVEVGSRRDKDRTCVDHCHETGKVRGLLCGRCNLGIGYLRHDPELLRKAERYLLV